MEEFSSKGALTPLLQKYEKMYKAKPKSRVFAPLAEVYRKLGMIDECLRILREGIRNHPSYLLGHIVLAKTYFDTGRYELAYTALLPFVKEHLDNLSLQKIYAESCEQLSYWDEALQTYKNLLFFSPSDQEIGKKVSQLEDQLIADTKSIVLDDEDGAGIFPTDFLEQDLTRLEDIDDWSMMDFSSYQEEAPLVEQPVFREKQGAKKYASVFNLEDWKELSSKKIEEPVLNTREEGEFVSHTLIDLYSSQGHYNKAYEIACKMRELNPNDTRLLDKINEIESLLDVAGGTSVQKSEDLLMEEFDRAGEKLRKSKISTEKYQKITDLYNSFLSELRIRAKHYV